jgi:hypothetical protein
MVVVPVGNLASWRDFMAVLYQGGVLFGVGSNYLFVCERHPTGTSLEDIQNIAATSQLLESATYNG